MNGQAVTVTLVNWDHLRRGIKPAIIDRPARDMFQRGTRLLYAQVMQRTPNDTGALRTSIVREVGSQNPYPTEAIVGTRLAYAPFVEAGRRPGRMPPVDAIEAWALRHGMRPGSGFYVARAIGRRGTKPVNMFRDALDASEAELQVIIRVFGDDIVEAMKRA